MSEGKMTRPPLIKPPEPAMRQSQLFFAAIMAALHDQCSCRACGILKEIANTMIKDLMRGVASGEGRGQT